MKNEGDALPAGTRVEQFVIERLLGLGGFGVTYLARDESLGVWRALKEYLPDHWGTRFGDGTVGPPTEAHADDYEWGLRRFLQEARMLAQFRHPHIVQVFQVVEAYGTAYMVMEYVEGRTLEEVVATDGPLPEERVRALLLSLTDGLSAMHAEDLLHRDVKPANVMVRVDGSPVLIDFGAARQAMGARASDVTQFSSPGYAPYEQYVTGAREGTVADRRAHQGPWTDIYALGAVAYWALSGKVPDAATVRMLSDDLPSVAKVASRGVSAGLTSAVDAALAVRAQDRPQSLHEWRTLLVAPAAPDPEPAPKPDQLWRRWPEALATVLVAVLVLVPWLDDPARDLEARLGRPVSALAADDNGWTDLHYAAALNLTGLAERLLEEGVPVDARLHGDGEPFTEDLQATLQALGVEVEFVTFRRWGSTPLHVAARVGATDAAVALLGQGADVAARDELDWVPLHIAAWRGHVEVIRRLVAHGADVAALSGSGQTPLHFAADGGRIEAIRELVARGGDVTAGDNGGWTPLHAAALTGQADSIRELVMQGADVMAHTRSGRTPLHVAAQESRVAALRELVAHGADLTARDDRGWTPLHAAANAGEVAAIRELATLGADIAARANDGWMPLHRAAVNSQVAAIRELVTLGADVGARTNDGWTALHVAAGGSGEVVAAIRELVTRGADVGARTNDGRTVLHVAAGSNAEAAAIRELATLGADIAARDDIDATPLHRAALAGHTEVIGVLVTLGAQVDVETGGQTPLYWAAFAGQADAIRGLVALGADVTARDNGGRTPRDAALAQDKPAAAELLRSLGG